MIITICNQEFDTNDIKDIFITDIKVMVHTTDDFYDIRYSNEEQIKEARNYLKFKELTRKELLQAVNVIITTCDYFISEKEQCAPCPLKKAQGCIFNYIPKDWRD